MVTIAQWLECPTGVRKVMGSIPVGDSDFFFVPRSQHAEYSIFSHNIIIHQNGGK